MFDPIQYSALKTAGSIVSATEDGNGNVTVVYKTFCPLTGVQGANATWSDTLADINATISSHQGIVSSLQSLVTDVTT